MVGALDDTRAQKVTAPCTGRDDDAGEHCGGGDEMYSASGRFGAAYKCACSTAAPRCAGAGPRSPGSAPPAAGDPVPRCGRPPWRGAQQRRDERMATGSAALSCATASQPPADTACSIRPNSSCGSFAAACLSVTPSGRSWSAGVCVVESQKASARWRHHGHAVRLEPEEHLDGAYQSVLEAAPARSRKLFLDTSFGWALLY